MKILSSFWTMAGRLALCMCVRVCLRSSKGIIQQWTERQFYSTKGRWRTRWVWVNSSSPRTPHYRLLHMHILCLLFRCLHYWHSTVYKNFPVHIWCFLLWDVDIFQLWSVFFLAHQSSCFTFVCFLIHLLLNKLSFAIPIQVTFH